MSKREEKDIGAIMANGEVLDRALAAAQRDAIRRHRLFGVPVAIWRDGKVVIVPAEEIQLPDEPGE